MRWQLPRRGRAGERRRDCNVGAIFRDWPSVPLFLAAAATEAEETSPADLATLMGNVLATANAVEREELLRRMMAGGQ